MLNKIFGNLYHGNMQDVIEVLKTKEVDVIVYLGQGLPKGIAYRSSLPIVHVPLNDGENIGLKIDLVLLNIAYLELDDKVLVACRAGLSRSVAICAAYLYIYQNEEFQRSFNKCLKRVQKIINQPNMPMPNPELIKSVKDAIKKYWG